MSRAELQTRLSLRLERRWSQIRAIWRGFGLKLVVDRTLDMRPGPIVVSTMRNEQARLPFFLDYYRRLGVVHFLIVDNDSTDGTGDYLDPQPDVSLWRTQGSYRASRFGVDWVNALLMRHGHGRWVLVVDPDEFLVYPHCDTRDLAELTTWLDISGKNAMGSTLIDMYSDRPIEETHCEADEDPIAAAPFFDALNYVHRRHERYHNLWIQGGPRMRVFFADRPETAPALNKIPLVKWHRAYVFRSSTHNLLPRRLNRVYEHRGGSTTSGALLHAKFLDVLTDKVAEEIERREHYDGGKEYETYAKAGMSASLWTPQSVRYQGWRQLCEFGLMSEGGWL